MASFNAAAFADLKPALAAELAAKDGLTAAQADAAATDYGRFLALVSDDKPTCPPSLADVAWHRHMEMASYADDQIKLCGRTLYHDKEAFGTEEFAAAWADTRARWAAAYGQDLEIDPTKADISTAAPAVCFERPEPSRTAPAVCFERPEPSRTAPAVCFERPEPSRTAPAVCFERP